MPRFLSARRDDFRLIPVPADAPMARRMRLEDLLWSAGYLASRGRMVAGGSLLDVVRIVRWPNFSRLPCSLDTMRMVALLTRHPTSIALATRILDIRQDEACRVYSAATCAGLVEVRNRRSATRGAGGDVSPDTWESGAQFASHASDDAEACAPAAAHEELASATVVQPARAADDAHATSAGLAAVDANPPARRGRRDTLLGQLLARIMGL